MRTSKYSEEQIIGFLRQAEAGMPIKELGRKHGFSDASFYKWRAKYGGMDVSKAKRLRELELENGKLKRLLAEAHLDIHALTHADPCRLAFASDRDPQLPVKVWLWRSPETPKAASGLCHATGPQSGPWPVPLRRPRRQHRPVAAPWRISHTTRPGRCESAPSLRQRFWGSPQLCRKAWPP